MRNFVCDCTFSVIANEVKQSNSPISHCEGAKQLKQPRQPYPVVASDQRERGNLGFDFIHLKKISKGDPHIALSLSRLLRRQKISLLVMTKVGNVIANEAKQSLL